MLLEVNVSRLVNELDPSEISGSVAERGKNAGPETWANAKEATQDGLLKPEERDAARALFELLAKG